MFIIFRLTSIKKQLLDLVYDFLHLKCIISCLDIDNSAYHKNLIQ